MTAPDTNGSELVDYDTDERNGTLSRIKISFAIACLAIAGGVVAKAAGWWL